MQTVRGTDPGGDATRVVLSGALTVPRALELRAELRQALDGATRVEVALEEVTEVDLGFVQLLCALHHSADEGGASAALVGARPDELVRLLASAGFRRPQCALTGCLLTTEV